MVWHARVVGVSWVVGVVMAVAMSGCAASPPPTPSSSGPADYQGIDSANVESVTLSIQVGPAPNLWIVEPGNARAYTVKPNVPDATPSRATSAPQVLTDTQVAGFRAMLDAVDIWSWAEWADANRVYAPAGNASVVLTSAGHSINIDLGAPSGYGTDGYVTGESSHAPWGWSDFYDAMTALAGA